MTGPPSAICLDQVSSTLPAEPSTLPNRTIEKAVSERRLLSWTLPGTSQLVGGRAMLGTLLLLGWLAAWAGAWPAVIGLLERFAGVGLRLDLLRTTPVPVAWTVSALGVISVGIGIVVWTVGNIWSFRRKKA